ncbi:MAG: hypothetical protein K8S14_08355, partial [Actinomycetia bacterium]|nr:hypothetical protein [Actinomycetes bacterium]
MKKNIGFLLVFILLSDVGMAVSYINVTNVDITSFGGLIDRNIDTYNDIYVTSMIKYNISLEF